MSLILLKGEHFWHNLTYFQSGLKKRIDTATKDLFGTLSTHKGKFKQHTVHSSTSKSFH